MSDGERRLVAIMFTDMVGYTALGQRNESLSLILVEEQRKLIRPLLLRHNGREVKTIGDAFLVEFPNALDAVNCAYDIQRATREFNVTIPEDRRIHLRIGVHLGDVVESRGDISGDAVNVASRIEPLAEDGGVCLTRPVYESTRSKFDLPLVSIGSKSLKNVSEPMEVYKMGMPWAKAPPEGSTLAFSKQRIAILPFRNMSPDPNDEFFAEGLTEEIISTVSGISGLKVISRTSVMHYKNSEKTMKEIGKELDVGSVLEGSLRKAGNRIRVTTQLIDVAGDEHLWAQNYDRNLDDVFEVQSDVAKQVADALRVRILSPEKERIEKRPTENTTAHTLYLKGRYLWNRRGLDDIKRAAECFEQSIKEDPDFALGYVGLADCYSLLRVNERVDPEQNLLMARELAAKALELDPDLAEAHVAKASLLGQEYDLRGAEEEFLRAIELKPGYATGHQWYCFWVLYPEQRWEEALKEIEKAVELDPLSPIIYLNYGDYYWGTRNYPRALELYSRGAALDPSFRAANLRLARTFGMMKRFDDMEREYAIYVAATQKMYPLVGKRVAAEEAQFRGDKQEVRRLLPELEADIVGSRTEEFGIAAMHFFLGETDEGFKWLERSYSRKDLPVLWAKSDPDLDAVRTDPRYLDLLKRLGLD